MTIIGKIKDTALVVVGPIFLDENAQLLSPLTRKVHQLALSCVNENNARAVQGLQYFAKPLDRIIQALAAPIFVEIRYVKNMVDAYEKEDYFSAVVLTIGAPVAIPVLAIWGIAQSTLFLANGALQVVAPYQTVYAVIKGKEGAREYFDYRESVVDRLSEKDSFTFYKKYHLCPLREMRCLKKPKKSLNDIHNQYPPGKYDEELFMIARAVDFIKRTPFTFLLLLQPAYLMPALRMIPLA